MTKLKKTVCELSCCWYSNPGPCSAPGAPLAGGAGERSAETDGKHPPEGRAGRATVCHFMAKCDGGVIPCRGPAGECGPDNGGGGQAPAAKGAAMGAATAGQRGGGAARVLMKPKQVWRAKVFPGVKARGTPREIGVFPRPPFLLLAAARRVARCGECPAEGRRAGRGSERPGHAALPRFGRARGGARSGARGRGGRRCRLSPGMILPITLPTPPRLVVHYTRPSPDRKQTFNGTAWTRVSLRRPVS